MGNTRAAFQHLWAAVQLLKASAGCPNTRKLLPVRETMMRLDFLGQMTIPSAQSSYFKAFAFQSPFFEKPFYSDSIFNAAETLDGIIHPDAINTQRLTLLRLIAAHNEMDRVVWSHFYAEEKPKRNALLSFTADLRLWRQNAKETFAGYDDCVPPPSAHSYRVSDMTATLNQLPMPPEALHVAGKGANITIIYYNCYFACAEIMLSTTEAHSADCTNREFEAMALVYNNLRLAQGFIESRPRLWSDWPSTPGIGPGFCANLDPSLTIPIFLGARRCFNKAWRDWTADVLRSLGNAGINEGHPLANCLTVLGQVEEQVKKTMPIPTSRSQLSPMGHPSQRTIPILMPKKEDDDKLEAFYLRHTSISGAIAKARWRQRTDGGLEDLQFKWYDQERRRKESMEPDAGYFGQPDEEDPLKEWKHSLEGGWHEFFKG